MCAIFGSRDLQEFLELAETNNHRGSYSYSIMGFSDDLNITHLKQHLGNFDNSKAEEVFQNSAYVIGHVQAPTDGYGNAGNIHPAHVKNLYLYHNGMIRSQSMLEMDHYRAGMWDTELLLKTILSKDKIGDALNIIEGSFACVLVNATERNIKVFTNNTCSLYINSKTKSISSMKMPRFKKVKSNVLYDFNPVSDTFAEITTFDNSDDIYFIPKTTKRTTDDRSKARSTKSTSKENIETAPTERS